ncbi:MAG: helix-turn-helix transcriptional regulator [Syntrophorhabdales bacterium]|jgi:transcriptional regulator with XRE-family HTH domain
MSAMGLAEELQRVRKVKNASLREVERATGISNAYLSQLEGGDATNPSPHILQKLAEFYEVPYMSLLKTAGYLEETRVVENKPSVPTPIQAVVMAAKLTEEETAKVADYIAYLQSQRKKRKRGGPK